MPTPCSPVQVPPTSSARATIRSTNSRSAACSLSDSTSTGQIQWKLPSATWPTIAAGNGSARASAADSVMHSARRETGTHTSVVCARVPGRGRR